MNLQQLQLQMSSIISKNLKCNLKKSNQSTYIKTNQKHFCLICFHLCQQFKFTGQKDILVHSNEFLCQCKSHMSNQFIRKNIINFINDMKLKQNKKNNGIQNLRLKALHTEIFKYQIVKKLYIAQCQMIQSDMLRFTTVKDVIYKWQQISNQQINSKNQIINFLKLQQNSKLDHTFQQFCKQILEKPFHHPQAKNYKNVIALQSNAMNLLYLTSFKSIMSNLERLDYQTLGSINIIARIRIRQRNLGRVPKQIRQKWFRQIKKWIEIYSIEQNKYEAIYQNYDNTYYVPIKMTRDLVVYGLIQTQSQLNQFKNILYTKMGRYINLQQILLSQKQIHKDFPNYLRQIREFYIEIFYHLFFLQNDLEVINTLKTQQFQFEKLKVFQSQFIRKSLQVCFKYALKQKHPNCEYDLLYSNQNQVITQIINKFLPIINNTEDDYLYSLWLTKNKDLDHYKQIKYIDYFGGNIFKQCQTSALLISTVMDNYFKQNKNLYSQQVIINIFNGELYKLFQLLNIHDELQIIYEQRFKGTRINPDRKLLLYYNQLILLQSTFLKQCFQFAILFLNSESKQINQTRQKLFTLFKFAYYKNNINISSFIQKSNFDLMQIYFPDQLFQLIRFSLYNNWVIFSQKGILKFCKIYWKMKLGELQKCEANSEKYEYTLLKLIKILEYIQRWDSIDKQKIFKYLPSSDLEIMQQLSQILDSKIINKKQIQNIFGSNFLNTEEQFYYVYFQTMILFSKKRYQFNIYQKIKSFFPQPFLINIMKTKISLRAKTILINIIQFFYINAKNNLLDNRDVVNNTKLLPRFPLYTDLYLEQQNLQFILNIINDQINNFVSVYEKNENMNIQEKQYFLNNVLTMILRLLNYFNIIPQKQAQQIHMMDHTIFEFFNNISKLLQQKHKIWMNLQSKYQSSLSIFTQIISSEQEFQKKIDNNHQSFQQINHILINFFNSFFKQSLSIQKYNSFLQPQIPEYPQKVILISKFQRQNLYSNKLDIRLLLKNSLLIKYKNIGTTKLYQSTVMYKLQIAYQDLKMSLTSTETNKNYFFKMLQIGKDDQAIIQNLCIHFMHELAQPITFRNRNDTYSLIQCICNLLFVSPINIQNMLYNQINNNKDWILKLWHQMLERNLFIRYKIAKDSVWIDQYSRFWIITKFMHFLIDMKNNKWKQTFKSIAQDDNQGIYVRLVSLIEQTCNDNQWHNNYVQDNLDSLQNKHSQYILKTATILLDLYNQLLKGPCQYVQQKCHPYMVLQINGIIKRYMKDYNSWMYELKLKAIQYLLAVTQGLNLKTIRYIIENFSITNLNTVMINSIKQLYHQYNAEISGNSLNFTNINDYKLVQSDFDNIFKIYATDKKFANHNLLNIAFKIFNYLKTIKKVNMKYKLFLEQRIQKALYNKGTIILKQQQLVVYKFLSKISSTIECYFSGSIQQVDFKIPGKCMYLTKSTKKQFLDTVNRQSPQDKINGLMSQYKFFKIQMTYYEQKFSKQYNLFTNILPQLKYIDILIYILAIIINGFLISDLGIQNSDKIKDLPHYNVYLILGYIIVTISILTWIIIMISSFGILYKIQAQKQQDLLLEGQELRLHTKLKIVLVIIFLSLDNSLFLFHFVITLLGLNVSAIFFSVLLISIVVRVQTLQYIIQAVLLHFDQLIVTYILQILVVYVYSFISYQFYQGRFIYNTVLDDNENLVQQQYCSNIVQCWTNLMSQAIVTTNGIGSLMGLQSFSEPNRNYYYARFFSDVSFYMIINVIFLNIIQGIIVDTFGQLRQKLSYKQNDENNICFICGQNKDNLISKGQSFKDHINDKHYTWNYVYFLIYIDEKDEKDCDGVELKLKKMIKQQDSGWVPTVSNTYENDEQQQKKKEQEKLNELSVILQKFKEKHIKK